MNTHAEHNQNNNNHDRHEAHTTFATIDGKPHPTPHTTMQGHDENSHYGTGLTPTARRHAATHKNTPEETALTLTHDKDAIVRAASHENTPARRKKELARGDNEPIALNTLTHPTDTPHDTIHTLTGRGNKQARVALLNKSRRH